ncbi:hypothetical protein WR25_17794 [Diploscapter pachys]|uniref:Peptidase M13 C-terminal domain-containing protein n=1 Tax=Diploscapter pachys TaxID=2018661 RepID=A0A2A2LF68_9BILA|nr:hypothetical protein WR25_17794 [Diploscapter pachys]
MLNNTLLFNYFVQWNQLLPGPADRTGFNGPPGTTNAWYQPELNSITFPAAILRSPFYDPNWPNSAIFGAMGVIAGHELTHGFDDEGVQWSYDGSLSSWMDSASSGNFSQVSNFNV